MHSAANYYNYALSKCTYSVATKLDADHLAIAQNLAPLMQIIRTDIQTDKRKMYFHSGGNWILESKLNRLVLLGFCAFAGLGLNWVIPNCWWVAMLKVNPTESLRLVVVGLPVLLTLWWFRTSDTREQIAKAEEQISKSQEQNYHSILFNGLENLTSDNLIKIDVGVDQLIRLSKTTAAFNDGIKLAFIKRLKACPLDLSFESKNKNQRLTYAQWILSWLVDNYLGEELDLNGCDFTNQDFELPDFQFAKIFNNDGKNKTQNMIFRNASLQNPDLQNANLQDANLSNAKLQKAKLQNADLRNADLSNAKLQNADLRNANLVETRFIGARLMDADLTGANLENAAFSDATQEIIEQKYESANDYRSADLRGANLTGATLTAEKLLGARIDKNTRGLEERFDIKTDKRSYIISCKVK